MPKEVIEDLKKPFDGLARALFGQIWRFTTPTDASGLPEQFYAKPLVYTPSSTGRQVVLAFSEQNKIYVLDAVNGTLYASRDLGQEGEIPFLVSDLGGCNDTTVGRLGAAAAGEGRAGWGEQRRLSHIPAKRA